MVFSDDSKFNLFGSNERQYCWRKKGERLLDQHVEHASVKFGDGNIMVLRYMNWEGIGNLSCHAPLFEECPQHHGHNGDPGVTLETCGAIGEGAQVILVWMRALGHGNASHP